MEQRTPKHFTPQSDPSIGAGLTEEVAAFVLDTGFDAIPGEVVELAKKSILDGFGLALSGSVAASGRIVQAHLKDVAGAGEAVVIGTGMKVPSRFAAFANGVGIHADDYDDTQLAVAEDRVYGLLTHPTAPCLPAAFAEAQTRSLSGRDMLAAYLVGVDVECKIAEAISPRHYQHGFHATATCGTFAAASAAGRLRGFDRETLQRALSIAGSQSAGLRENFGTMTKPFHAGRSSEAGVVACDFAELGWSATDKILEAPRGFFQAHGGGYDLDAIRGKLGAPWTFADPGISIKPHPSGSLTHPGMTEMLSLIKEHGIRAEDVEKVDVGTNHNMLNALIHHRPRNELQAKFSMEFCMAILLLDGRANLPEFTDETVLRDDVQAMIERVDFHMHPDAEAAGYAKMTTIIDIRMKDGRTISGRADFGKGSPANPMTYEEAADKFRGCAEFAGWPKDKGERIIDLVADLDGARDLEALAAALSA
ncbi:MmgE/PrpD family protein [Lutibaculum baratangense]|uniref:Immune-responsive protein 1 n=1 Tax=Lutibaculum baratangense AMV1 TaxID=631454 RepID=V4RLC3_9HYPH|nr:MmgE/PrpD family protein [Lutibaculum baratangense]ESR26109.1 Immune-responsive protein 1 [Lutibaculum baratangense AMV1]